MIEINAVEAIKHETLQRFVKVKEGLVGLHPLHLDHLEAPELAPFHDNLIISRRLAGGEDFAFEYWGAENTEVYGFDLSGKTIMTANFGDLANLFMTIDCQVLSMKGSVYLNGLFDWLDRDHQRWYRVAMPLMGPEGLERVISYTSFEPGE